MESFDEFQGKLQELIDLSDTYDLLEDLFEINDTLWGDDPTDRCNCIYDTEEDEREEAAKSESDLPWSAASIMRDWKVRVADPSVNQKALETA